MGYINYCLGQWGPFRCTRMNLSDVNCGAEVVQTSDLFKLRGSRDWPNVSKYLGNNKMLLYNV